MMILFFKAPVALLCMLPLIAFASLVPVPDYKLWPYPHPSHYLDVFAWAKLLVLIFLSMMLLIGAGYSNLGYIFKKSIRFRVLSLLVISFFITLLISTVQARFKWTAALGFPGHYEGALAYMCYLVVFMFAASFNWDKSSYEFIKNGFSIAAIVLAILGVLQFYDIIQLNEGFLRKLVLHQYSADPNLKIHHAHGGTVSFTLSNPNFVGSYSSLLIPFFLATFLGELKKFRCLMTFVALFFVICIGFGCHSISGLIGSLSGCLLVVFKLRKIAVKNHRSIMLLCCALALAAICFGTSSKMEERLKWQLSSLSTNKRVSLSSEGNVIEISQDSKTIKLKPTADGVNFSILDYFNRPIPFQKEKDGWYSSLGELEIGFKPFFDHLGNRLFELGWDSFRERFYFEDGQFFLSILGRPRSSIEPENAFFFRDSLFSGRGYIWNRSIPLVAKNILIGQGYGTFAIHFPQNDFFGKISIWNKSDIIIGRPHNLFLQIALGSGLLSLIIFLSIVSICALPILVKGASSFDSCGQISLLGAVFGFLVSSIGNDSSLFVSPLFWFFLGLLANYAIRLKDSKAHQMTGIHE